MSETDPTKPDPQRPIPPRTERAGSREPIPLEPGEQAPAPPPTPARKPRIDSPGLLDDFDEDADLTSDPEVERIVKGIPVGEPSRTAPKAAPAEAEPAGPPLCPSPAWKLPAAIGAVLTITAAVFAGINAPDVIWAYVLRTIYWAAVHTATGVGALVAAALLLGRPVGHFESAGARMFMAVSAFLVIFNLGIPLTTGRLEEVVLGAAAYFGMLVAGFRFPPRDAGVVGGAHFGLALLLSVGSQLAAVIGSAGAAQ